MGKFVNLIKLSVGTESVEQLEDWQRRRSKQVEDGQYYHVTRMWPKREAEVLDGGSIYWVIKGEVQARQRVTAFRERIGQDGIRRCAIMLDPTIVRVTPSLKRPFQGWRYLEQKDAPMDLPAGRSGEAALPDDLNRALAEIGVL